MRRTKGRPRRGNGRANYDAPRTYAHELHEIADAMTRNNRKLSTLSAIAARHGLDLQASRCASAVTLVAGYLKKRAMELRGQRSSRRP